MDKLLFNELFDEINNALNTELLNGEYAHFEDVCVEASLAKAGFPGHLLVVWGEENDEDDKFFSVSIYTTDKDGQQDIQVLSTFSDEENIDSLKTAVHDVLTRFEQQIAMQDRENSYSKLLEKAYELYKKDWMETHGFGEKDIAGLREQYNASCIEFEEAPTEEGFQNYIEEVGFGSEIYVCKDEFESSEFRDSSYMKQLLNDSDFASYETETAVQTNDLPLTTEKNHTAYAIYQLKDEEDLVYHRFASLDLLQRFGLSVEGKNYEKVYKGYIPLDNSVPETLENLYYKFNMEHPEDFTGHSLSVSDVIVLTEGNYTGAFFVDSIGFKEVPQFFASLPEHKNALDNMIQSAETRRSSQSYANSETMVKGNDPAR